jgi:hypothetical protein
MKTSKARNLLFIVFLLSMVGRTSVTAQHFDFGYEYGFSSYFGDLAPFAAVPSMAKSSSSKGYYFGYGNKNITIFANYTVMEIFADDRNAEFENRVQRNLSFKSPIIEYGLTAEVSILNLFSRDYRRLQPLIITGVNVFYFNPYTIYQGERIDLRPLATEGQGTSEYPDRELYSLTQISIPLGVGVKYELTDKLWIGAGAKLRMTFTDYLDDVSTTYADPEVLAAYNGSLSAELAYRGDELDPSRSVEVGSIRGNPSENDWYMTTYFTVGLRFKEEKTQRRRRPRTGRIKSNRKIKCPTF